MTTPIPPDEEIEALIEWLDGPIAKMFAHNHDQPHWSLEVQREWKAEYDNAKSAAAALRSLSARNRALREALEELLGACVADFGEPDDWDDDESVIDGDGGPSTFTFGHIRRARTALSEQTKPVETT